MVVGGSMRHLTTNSSYSSQFLLIFTRRFHHTKVVWVPNNLFNKKWPTVVDAYGVAARVTVLGKQSVETLQTVRTAVFHYVSLASELLVALQACKVFHVPSTTFCFRTFVSQNNLRAHHHTIINTNMQWWLVLWK